MANASPTAIKALLKRYNLGPKKGLGQHFLWQSHVVERIAESAELTKDDVVLEIGPGLGILTEALARQAGMVIAVEIDRALFPLLQEVLQDYDNIRLVEGDALKVNFDELLKECVPGFTGACKVVGNLPYYITSPLLMGLLMGSSGRNSLFLWYRRRLQSALLLPPGERIMAPFPLLFSIWLNLNYSFKYPPIPFFHLLRWHQLLSS